MNAGIIIQQTIQTITVTAMNLLGKVIGQDLLLNRLTPNEG